MWKKMNKNAKGAVIELVVVAVIGTLLHFLYEWSGGNPLMGLFSPVNESVWEHLKLLFMPAFFYTMLQEILRKDGEPSRISQKSKAIICALLFIVVFFYTYSGILGKSVVWIDIATFYVSVLLYIWKSYKKSNEDITNGDMIKGYIVWWGLLILFFVFTMWTPPIGLFREP